ncbi:hypothetical protein ACSSVQ_001385 [Parvibaculum sp. MBR-TMA-1.3b-4.2]|jgi:hypothetical protein
MSLTDVAVRTAKPKSKAYRLFDGNGLFLLVTTKGQRYWRYQYRHGGAGSFWRWVCILKCLWPRPARRIGARERLWRGERTPLT